MERSPEKLTNPYKQGADDGTMFGLYLIALFFASAFALEVPGLGILATVMIFAVPVIIFFALRRTWVRDRGMSLFSALWMQGIMIFICGGLLSGLVSFIYLRWINPAWLGVQVNKMIELYSSVDGGKTLADTLRTMVNQGLLPSSIQMVIQMLWIEIFSGSVLSLIITAFVRMTRAYKHNDNLTNAD